MDRVTRDFGGTPLKFEGDAEAEYKRIPVLTPSSTDGADGTGTFTLQVQDAGGNDVSGVHAVRAWISGEGGAEYGAPDGTSINTFGVGSSGTLIQTVTSTADIYAVTDATGELVLNLDTTNNVTVWCMAELDGRVYSVSVDITGNA